MAKPVIPQGFVLDEVNTQQTGLPSGFVLDDPQELSQPRMSMGEAAFTTATNPLGFGDEIKAGIAAGVAKLFGGAATQNIDIGDLYREARTAERVKLERARQERPLTSFAGQVFSDVGIAGKGLKALGLAGQGMGAAVKGGAALGGASALGETEDLTNIPQTLKDVATGSVVGGALGGAVQQAIPAAQSAVGAISQTPKKVLQKITGIDPKAVKTFQELGIEPTLADVSNSAGIQNFVKDIPVAGKPITEALQKQINDISGQIQGVVKASPKNPKQMGSQIQQAAKEFKTLANARVSALYDDLDKYLPKETIGTAAKQRQDLFEIASGNSGIQTEQELFDLAKQYERAQKEVSNNKSLFQFIKERGGIADYKGELKNLGIDNKTLPGFLRKEGSKGVGIDDVGEKLMEAGYFSERPTVNQVLNLIEQEARGNKVYLNPVDDATQFINEVNNYGVDLKAIKQLQNTPKIGGEAKQLQKIPTDNLRNLIKDAQIQDVVAVGTGDTAKVLNRYSNIVDDAGNISYPRLKTFRSVVGAKLDSPTLLGDERAALKRIYGSLSEDMKQAVVKNGGDEALQAFNKANAAFERKINFLEKNIDPIIKAKTPEKVYKLATSGIKDGGTQTKRLMNILKPEQQEYVRASIVRDMGLAQKNAQSAEGDVFSPQKFMAEYSVLKKNGTEKAIFTPEQVTAFNRLNKVVELTKNTEQAGQQRQLMQAIGLGTIGGTTGIGGLATTMVGARISANLMTNPKFINWLAITAQATPKELPKQLNRLSAITAANPEIREDVLEFLSSFNETTNQTE